MANFTSFYSLTNFQGNAQTYIESIFEIREPMLLTVNVKVQALLFDPVSYQQAKE